MFNHEVWVKCTHCHNHFDARDFGYGCPYCKKENK